MLTLCNVITSSVINKQNLPNVEFLAFIYAYRLHLPQKNLIIKHNKPIIVIQLNKPCNSGSQGREI